MSKLKITKSMVYIDGVPTHMIQGMAELCEVNVHHKFHDAPEVTFKFVLDEVEVDSVDISYEKH